ncbi:MAG: hypothetical protein COY80_02790 [Candidatus Pacebacteria bacterium CG_4_10_14_0_8_um_filter_42_14]|nr:MAG: hypothetical protein COY80_02790 [Candidatus Pacebacteria bacterium CG_4_10_14_0_8_um_filter_42_14]
MTAQTEQERSPNEAEVDFFPWDEDEEVSQLKELIGDRELDLIKVGTSGYMVVRRNQENPDIVAEAPWVLFDFDDTAARTTYDKTERCWASLEEMGLPEDLVKFCDKICRVDFGEAGKLYQPELEMRLVTLALQLKIEGQDQETIESRLGNAITEMIRTKNLSDFVVLDEIRDLYKKTRYTSTLYPDTLGTLKRLHNPGKRPINIAFLTHGDPYFQLSKTITLMDQSPEVSAIFLTKTKKGKFFSELVELNPFKDVPIRYSYDETERDEGILFQKWQVMVTLCDDDPNQIESINKCAQDLGMAGLGAVRVRRSGAKRADTPLSVIPEGSAEIITSDTLMDTDIFEAAFKELQTRILEKFVIKALKNHFYQSMLGDLDFKRMVQTISENRGRDYDEELQILLALADIEMRSLMIDED